MKKLKIIKIINVIALLLFVVGLPVLWCFMPLQEPDIVNFSISEVSSDDYGMTEYHIEGEFKNPTIFKMDEVLLYVGLLEFDDVVEGGPNSEIYDEDWDIAIDGLEVEVELEGSFNAFGTKKFYANFTAETFENYKADWFGFDYGYSKINVVFIILLGLVLYFIFSAFFMKQKFYFEIDGKKAEVYVGANKAALIINGQIVCEQKFKGNELLTKMEYAYGEKKLEVKIRRSIGVPSSKADITFDGQVVEITDAKQHSFLKEIDK